ncbi:MAG: MFS transporter, partial [Pseudomonadota bacterium]
LFVGGALGGVLAHQFGPPSVFVLGSILIGLWLLLALGMRTPPVVKNLMYHVSVRDADDARRLEQRLAVVPGVAEAVVLAEEGAAYLKVNAHTFDEQALRQVLAST